MVGDLRDIDHVDHLLVVNRIEAVVHFAAHCYVGESVTDPAKYYTNNLIHTLNLIDRCRRNGIQKFVFSSTCATYGVPTTVPITEDEKQAPINPYGNTKLAVEHALADYADRLPVRLLRPALLQRRRGRRRTARIGEDHDPETHLIPLVLQAALGKRPHVEIFGTDYPTPDGTCIRDYIHVDDLAAAHILALEKIAPATRSSRYNVGIGRGYSVREVIEAAEAVTGQADRCQRRPAPAGRPGGTGRQCRQGPPRTGWKAQFTESPQHHGNSLELAQGPSKRLWRRIANRSCRAKKPGRPKLLVGRLLPSSRLPSPP